MAVSIAIDGPAGAGKSTISKIVAKRLGFLYIDTGAMYRAVGLFALQSGCEKKEQMDKLVSLLPQIDVSLSHDEAGQHVFLNGREVTDEIRTKEVSVAASDVAVIREVRLFLVDLQRKIAKEQNVVMDGRDIGTYVLPQAQVKIFLTASLDDRAHRRYEEMLEKGMEADFDEVRRDMAYRDENDSTRAFAPLRPADDAIKLDTSGNTLQQSVELITSVIETQLSGK